MPSDASSRGEEPRRGALDEQFVRASVRARLFGTGDVAVRVGRFTLLERVGEGSMGAVWAAYDDDLDRRVALKLLHASDDDEDAAARDDERILREARAMASVNHPNVAHVYEVGSFEQRIFIAMEFVDGATLRRWQRDEAPDWGTILGLYAQAGRALAAAHEAGIVHRDFKPDNALVGRDGRVRVVDFGLAHSGLVLGDTRSEPGGESTATATRRRAGTPAYMAPEQFRGETVDGRADQFAFCVALFEALTGERPFAGTTSQRLYTEIERGEVPRARLPAIVPGRVRAAIVRGLAPDRGDRYASMAELLAVLDRDPSTRRRRITGTLAVGGVALVAVAVGRSSSPAAAPACPDPAPELDGVWDDARRDAARQALRAAAPSFAVATSAALESVLDAYAAGWLDARRSTCDATLVLHEQSEALLDGRMRCLDERRHALAALVDAVVEADPKTAERAVDAALRLPAIGRCANAEYIEAAHPLPDRPADANAVSAGLERVARARALHATGRFAEAAAEAEVVLEDAVAQSHAPLLARAQHARAAARASLGEVEAAQPELREAYATARLAGLFGVAGWSASDLAYVLGRHTSRRDEARAWAQLAEVEGRVVADVRLQAAARNAFGVAAIHAEDRPAAREAFHDAVRLLEDQPLGADALTYRANLARTMRHDGKLAEAAAMLEDTLRVTKARLGAQHPSLVTQIDALAEIWLILDRPSDAEALLERGLAISERTRGGEHADTARLLSMLGRARLGLGRLDEARIDLERAAKVSAAASERGDGHGVLGLDALAAVHQALGQPQLAITYLRRNVREVDRWMGERTRDAAVARGQLAGALMAVGESEEALTAIERSTEIFEEVLGPDHLDVSQAVHYRAQAYAAAGRTDAAITDLERAIRIREAALGASSHKLAELFLAMAQVRLQRGQPAEALTAAEHAGRLLAGKGLPPGDVASVDAVIARALVESGADRSRAAGLARRALQDLRSGPPGAQAEADALEAWMRASGLTQRG